MNNREMKRKETAEGEDQCPEGWRYSAPQLSNWSHWGQFMVPSAGTRGEQDGAADLQLWKGPQPLGFSAWRTGIEVPSIFFPQIAKHFLNRTRCEKMLKVSKNKQTNKKPLGENLKYSKPSQQDTAFQVHQSWSFSSPLKLNWGNFNEYVTLSRKTKNEKQFVSALEIPLSWSPQISWQYPAPSSPLRYAQCYQKPTLKRKNH